MSTQTTEFKRDEMAKWYASQHLKTDPSVRSVHYLPTGAPDREIRFVEVNTEIAERTDAALEPLEFGANSGVDSEHKLFILDVTPNQWDRINEADLALPIGWSLVDMISKHRDS